MTDTIDGTLHLDEKKQQTNEQAKLLKIIENQMANTQNQGSYNEMHYDNDQQHP